MNYSGTTTFDFIIERYKSSDGSYMMSDNNIIENEFTYQPINLKITGKAFFAEGRRSGDALDCFPDEYESDIVSAIDNHNNDWSDKLSETEREIILESILNNVQDQFDNHDNDYCDDFNY